MSDWFPEQIADLERLWAEGIPCAEIGRRLGKSKNSVISKANRLKLTARTIAPPRIDKRRAFANGLKREIAFIAAQASPTPLQIERLARLKALAGLYS